MTTIYVTRRQADAIGWDKDENKLLIRSCFYLGYGVIYMMEIVGNSIYSEECKRIIRTAEELGMTEEHPRVEVAE